MADEIAAAFDRPVDVKHLPARNEVVHAFSDSLKVRRVFAPLPPTDLRSGIRWMATWVKGRGPASPVRFSDIEICDKLPTGWES